MKLRKTSELSLVSSSFSVISLIFKPSEISLVSSLTSLLRTNYQLPTVSLTILSSIGDNLYYNTNVIVYDSLSQNFTIYSLHPKMHVQNNYSGLPKNLLL